MSNVIKIKRSETEASVPSTSDLAVGEVALNTYDKKLYTRDSNDSIIAVANFSKADPNQVFPTGDYGDLTNPDTDAFNVIITASFDCLTKPTAALVTEDFGSI
jgi:DNA-binding beta-propeller fold protein YncE